MGKIKQTKKTSRTVSGNFTDKTGLKNSFFVITSARQAEKISNDGTYWNNGRCEWGGSHSLDEDIDILANFFNSLAKVDDDINEIKLSANETIFNQRKQLLISKIQQLLNNCRVTSATSVGGICIIWNDFFGKFLKKYLDNFSSTLTRQLSAIEKLEPKHQQQLLQLEDDIRNAESKYNENLAKYNDPNTSPEEKTKLMILVNEAIGEIKRAKSKLKHNPLTNLERFNYLDDLEKLMSGNAPEPTTNPTGSSSRNRNSGNNGGSSNNNDNPNPIEDPKGFFEQNKTMIVIVIGLLGLMLYIYTQKDLEDDEEVKEEKKLMRQIALMKAMNNKSE